MKNYKKIDSCWGMTIDMAVNELLQYKERGELAFLEFNGIKLYSDTVTLDGAYIAITGITKADHEERVGKQREEYKREGEKYQAKSPLLVAVWQDKGRAFVKLDKLDLWDKCVPARLNDLYHGMELGACEEIIIALNNGCTIGEAKTIIENQNHSGMSYGLVRSMVREFAERGQEFFEATVM